MMIGVELLRELIESVILTGRVRGADPISLLLIGAPESGKTSVVLSRSCETVEAFADVTGRGLHLILKDNPKITHIVINDLVAVLSHRQSVNRYTMSQLNAMTEEGISQMATPAGIEKFPNGKRGVIASLTLDLVKDSRCWWNKIGFASRMLPFCYNYPTDLIIKIKEQIDTATGEGKKPKEKKEPPPFIVPKESIQVDYPKKILQEVRQIADFRSTILGEVGMRRLKQYHSLAQGHALLRSRAKCSVNMKDVEFLKQIDLYVNYDKPFPLKAPKKAEEN